MTHKDFAVAYSLESSAFVVVFPIIGSFLQLLILSFVYDSPDSLGKISEKIILTQIKVNKTFGIASEIIKKSKEVYTKKLRNQNVFMVSNKKILYLLQWRQSLFQFTNTKTFPRIIIFGTFFDSQISINRFKLVVFLW